MKKSQIFKIYGTEFQKMTEELLATAKLADMIGDRGLCVGIKPNLVTETPADFGATTHPEIVAGIIAYLQENGFRNILVTEGSWVGGKTADAYEYCGYREICEKYNVPFIDAQKDGHHEVDCDGVKLNICNVVDKVDFLINVPVLKGHCQTKITCALKNMKGLIPNSEKRRFHKMGLHKPIAHLSRGIHQDFIVVDHICGDLDFEEGGHPVVRNCIMAAMDPVLVDSYVCQLLHYTVDDVPYVRLAEKLGSGNADVSSAEIITLNRDGVLSEDDELPQERKILKVSYAVDEVDSCSACYGSLIPALYRLQEEGLLEQLHERISIGQGHQGKRGTLGIGRCTKDFDYCIMGCPPNEEKVYNELKEYILKNKENV